MFRLGHALAVQFKNQFRMTGLEQRLRNDLMARHAVVGADVKIFQVAHSGGGAVGARPVGARVRAQPFLRRAVAAFAGDAFADLEIFTAQIFRDFMQRCVAGGAARIRRRVFDLQRVGDLFGARGGERGGRPLRMEILERPGEELILLRAAAAVAAGTGAGIRAEKGRRRVRAAGCAGRKKNSGEKNCGRMTNCFTHGVKLVNGVAA